MKTKLLLIGLAVWAAAAARAQAPRTGTADLSWLSGDWQGTLANGNTFHAHYTDATGGVILSVSKELNAGHVVFYELEHFAEEDGGLVYTPHPQGRKSREFPLLAYEATKQRVVFENLEHDFPKRFTFERKEPDRLVITLSGTSKEGQPREIVYDLRQAK